MLEWIAEKLGLSWLLPFSKLVGFVITFIGAVLSELASGLPSDVSAGLFGLSIVFAIGVFISSLECKVAGFFAGMVTWYWMLYLTGILNQIDQSLIGCVMFDKGDISECINAVIQSSIR